MTVPAQLKRLLDDVAGKEHSADGPVMTCLADILARHEQMVRQQAAEQVAAYRCAYEMCSQCSCRADLAKLIGGEPGDAG